MYQIKNRREIIERKELQAELAEMAEGLSADDLRDPLLARLRQAHDAGRVVISGRLAERGANGRQCAEALSFLIDQILRTLYEITTTHVYPLNNPTAAERLSLIAVGGYGRGQLAPYSDIDLLFLLPYKRNAWVENVAEYMLYILWDLGLKVGHATRSADECIAIAKRDLSTKTALLESRYIWGDKEIYDAFRARFDKAIIKSGGRRFVEEKLKERDERHIRMGDSRYVVEPNLKEGKGGLRDLQTLFWIAKFLYRTEDVGDLIKAGVFTEDEFREFRKAERFQWTVRFHLHEAAGRAEERLLFDLQPELAARLRYRDHPGASGVERFMKHYFLIAKRVGDLTRIFCAALEAQHKKRGLLARAHFGRRSVKGFKIVDSRLMLAAPNTFRDDPVKLLEIFAVAAEHGLDIHPEAFRLIGQNLNLIDRKLRRDPRANGFFMDVLTSRKNAEVTLRMMNEAGVFGKFIPDFGRVVAQTQFDMYHHFTVDEHTIRALGLLAKIEAGEFVEDHPLASTIIHKVLSRRVLYLAVLFHDIAKGRGGDHSIIGAGIAERVCPRLGLDEAETETVAWLVRYHLLMSHCAFKRDVSDPQTVIDFCAHVASPERLRLLITLTVVDIRAVGPGVWNGWKGQLLRDLYNAAEELLMAGHMSEGRKLRVKERKAALKACLSDWPKTAVDKHLRRFLDSYWIAEEPDGHERDARLMRRVQLEKLAVGVDAHVDAFRAMTRVSVTTKDRPGLFADIAGALSVCGANIADAKIFTTKDGMALDSFAVQDFERQAFDDARELAKLAGVIEKTLAGELKPAERLARRGRIRERAQVFKVAPRVLIDNKASNRFTVIEINARDRIGLLFDLARALVELEVSISSAHVATYGERAVDVFYITDLKGEKIANERRLARIEARLVSAAAGPGEAKRRRPPARVRRGTAAKSTESKTIQAAE